jgi:hypothetical protein
MSEFRFDAFNTGVVQLQSLLCSEHGATHFAQFFSVLIRYVVKKFTTYFIVHFTNCFADFRALLDFLRFSHPSKDTALWGGFEIMRAKEKSFYSEKAIVHSLFGRDMS